MTAVEVLLAAAAAAAAVSTAATCAAATAAKLFVRFALSTLAAIFFTRASAEELQGVEWVLQGALSVAVTPATAPVARAAAAGVDVRPGFVVVTAGSSTAASVGALLALQCFMECFIEYEEVAAK